MQCQTPVDQVSDQTAVVCNSGGPKGKPCFLPKGESSWLSYVTPAVSIESIETSCVFTVELPNVQPNDIALAFVDGTLTLRAICYSNGIASNDHQAQYYFRKFGFSDKTDMTQIEAIFADGVLKIIAPNRLVAFPTGTISVQYASAA